jgi:hypothetical protein
MPYRDEPLTTRVVLGERHGLGWGRVALAIAAAAGVAVLVSHQVHLDCSRASGQCVARDVRIFGTDTREIPLASMTGAVSDGMSVKIQTRDGPVLITNSSESGGSEEKAAMAAAVDGFLGGTAPELHVSYGSALGNWWMGAFVGLLILAFGQLFRLRATLHGDGHTLRIERTLLGLLPKVTETDLTPYRSAELTSDFLVGGKKVARDKGFGVVLNSADGQRTLLEDWSSARPVPTQHLVAALNGVLAADRPIPVTPEGTMQAAIRTNLPFERWVLVAVVVLVPMLFWKAASANLTTLGALGAFYLLFVGQMLRMAPRRALLVYERQVALETSTFGFFPKRTVYARERIRAVVLDTKNTVSVGVALLLDDGQHIGVTPYSNVSFGAPLLKLRIERALGLG